MENTARATTHKAGFLKDLKSIKNLTFFIKGMRSMREEKAVEIDPTVDLILRLKDTKTRLDAMRNAFEFETDFNMIDAYIMEINGLEKQYSFLLNQIRRLRLKSG